MNLSFTPIEEIPRIKRNPRGCAKLLFDFLDSGFPLVQVDTGDRDREGVEKLRKAINGARLYYKLQRDVSAIVRDDALYLRRGKKVA